METTVPTPQSYTPARKETLMWVDELFEAYYIGELNHCLTRLLKMAVGSPLFIEEHPHQRAELVGDIVSIMRYLDFLADAYQAEKGNGGAGEKPERNKD